MSAGAGRIDAAVAIDPVAPAYPPRGRAVAAFAFLMLAEFFYSWAWNTVDVLRPQLRRSLGLTLTQAGSGYSAQGAGALIGAIVAGQLADRLGRRSVLATLMIGYGLALIAGTAVASYRQFLAERFVLGLFMGGVFPTLVGIYVGLFAGNVRGRLASIVNAGFYGAISALGLASGLVGESSWRTLLWWGGLPPVLLAGLAFVVIPRAAAGGREAGAAPRGGALPVAELFRPELRRSTLLLAALTGLNFFAYQAYNGWLTTYLKDVRGLSGEASGFLVAWQFGGGIAGGFFWGWAADRFGRRFEALGFILAAAVIAAFLAIPTSRTTLSAIGCMFGFALASSVIWGPWITELYPAHLKSTAASIFNWGRVVSFFAPLITGAVATRFGLTVTMALAGVTFLAAALVWLSLPETHPRPLLRPWARLPKESI